MMTLPHKIINTINYVAKENEIIVVDIILGCINQKENKDTEVFINESLNLVISKRSFIFN